MIICVGFLSPYCKWVCVCFSHSLKCFTSTLSSALERCLRITWWKNILRMWNKIWNYSFFWHVWAPFEHYFWHSEEYFLYMRLHLYLDMPQCIKSLSSISFVICFIIWLFINGSSLVSPCLNLKFIFRPHCSTGSPERGSARGSIWHHSRYKKDVRSRKTGTNTFQRGNLLMKTKMFAEWVMLKSPAFWRRFGPGSLTAAYHLLAEAEVTSWPRGYSKSIGVHLFAPLLTGRCY